MSVEEMFAGIPNEDERIEIVVEDEEKEGEEKETPSESQPEKTDDKESPSQEGEESEDKEESEDSTPDEDPEPKAEDQVPFHEHPRFKEVIQQKNDFKKMLEDQQTTHESQMADLTSKIEGVAEKATPQEMDPLFKQLYGDNPEAFAIYQQMQTRDKETLLAQVRQEIATEQQAKTQEVSKWNTWVDSELTSLETQGKKFDRNELMSVALKYKPTDDTGNISFAKAYEIMEQAGPKKNPEKTKAKKKAAALTTTKSKGEPTSEKVMTSHDLKNRSWYGYNS